MRKTFILFALVVFALFAFALPVLAAPNHQAVFVIGQSTYIVDGQVRDMDAVPFIENDRTYVPVRYLAYALGVAEKDVGWDGNANTVTLKLGDITLKMVIGSKTLYVNGQVKQMDVAPLIRDGRTYLPARWVAEAFGYEVKWDENARAVLVGPPGNPPEPPQPPQPPENDYKIDMAAARNGTLKPPPGVVAPPDEWGFPAKAVRMEFKVGNRYAKVTRPDGSTYQLDLGTECVVVTAKEDVDWLQSNYPTIYKPGTYVIVNDRDKEYWALYVPFIPVAEAFGVPKENIVWDGKYLAVFGYYGYRENYRVLTPGSKESVCRVIGNNPEVAKGHLCFPLFVKDGVPMVGINSVSDIYGMLFMTGGGSAPNLINAMGGAYWTYENGIAIAEVTRT